MRRANRTQGASGERTVAAVDAGLTVTVPSARAAASASVHLDAASAPAATGPCTPRPEGGILIPAAARATHIRIAAAGSRALVTFWDSRRGSEGPDVDRALGYLFDASTASIGAKLEPQKNDVGDEPVSAAVPVALSGGLFAISCAWAAPAGRYACVRARAEGGERPTSLFAFAGIANGGPERPDDRGAPPFLIEPGPARLDRTAVAVRDRGLVGRGERRREGVGCGRRAVAFAGGERRILLLRAHARGEQPQIVAHGHGDDRRRRPGQGGGKTTRTKVARACGGTIAASSVSALSTSGVEGGRAYVATDPADATSLFAVWQEIPAGKAAELRVAKLTCR